MIMARIPAFAVLALALPLAVQAASPSPSYTAGGLPQMSVFTPGKTTFNQVRETLGEPVFMQTDSDGRPTSASFYVPLMGETTTHDSAATKMVKSSIFSKLRSHAGGLLSHIPGVGGVVAAEAMDAGTAQAAGKLYGIGAKVWACTINFARGRYQTGSCATINRPIG